MNENYTQLIGLLHQPATLMEVVENGKDFKILDANKALYRLEGRKPNQIIGHYLSEQPQNKKLLEIAQEAIRDGEPRTLHHEVEDGGLHLWIDITALALDKKTLLFTYNDMTERKEDFPLSGESSRVLKSLFDVTPDWIFVKDQDFRYIFVNDGYANALQTTAAQIIGKTDEEMGFPHHMIYGDEKNNIRGFRQDDTEVLTTGKTVYNPNDPATFADGSIHIFDTRKIPLLDDNNEVYGVLGIARDITHRKEMEDALAKSESLSWALLEATFDSALLISSKGEILAANGRCQKLFPTLKVGGRIKNNLLIDNECFKNVIRDGQTFRTQTEFSGKVYDITYNPIHDLEQNADQIAIFIRDISHEIQLEDQLRQSEKMRAIGQLAGGIAHDFNNQLFGIVGYLELLQVNIEEESHSRYVKNALKSANRAADLTKQLLVFSRKGKNLTVPIDIHDIIEEVASILERSLDKRIHLSLKLWDDVLYTMGDPTQLQNALLNLALNGRDAMPKGGNLRFRTSLIKLDAYNNLKSSFDLSAGSYVKIAIEDTGVGIPNKLQGRIFEPFYTTKPEGRGVGMGLSAVYGTVNNHQGAIEVCSTIGKGTSMNLYFPWLQEDKLIVDEKLPLLRKKSNGRVLVIDDEDFVAEVATELLQELGYEVVAYNNPQDGAAYYRTNYDEIDVVLFDMVMPGINGIDLFKQLLLINPSVQGVLMSGFGIDGQVQEVLDLGAKSFLSKPFTIQDLSDEIGKLIN